ncbi:MAG: preprotein translocase subunit YajC [Planctomycetota bacterium]|jgi:preprotein translocase subunit YajC
MDNIWILAQAESGEGPSGISSEPVSTEETTTMTTTAADPNAPAGRKQPPGIFGNPLLMIGLMLVVMYLFLFRGPRKKQQQHKQMVQDLQKNDKIRTIGGIIGTIVDIKDGEITLKVDESSNTKIKVTPSAIGTNLSKDKK